LIGLAFGMRCHEEIGHEILSRLQKDLTFFTSWLLNLATLATFQAFFSPFGILAPGLPGSNQRSGR